jgi:hypothetical protein
VCAAALSPFQAQLSIGSSLSSRGNAALAARARMEALAEKRYHYRLVERCAAC